MTQPLGNCPGCGADEPFEQIHAGHCPDAAGACPEWACTACGTGLIMGTIPGWQDTTGRQDTNGRQGTGSATARASVRAA